MSKDAHLGTDTTLLCKITGLTAKATVIWNLDSAQQGGQEGNLADDGSQTSTLTVADPQQDTEYTCMVTSGQYPTSTPSITTVALNVYCKNTKK